MKTNLKSSVAGGFSLVELLVVIAVIAIIAAIAIPNIANITGQANASKNARNAQNIASVASAALAAGYEPTWTDATTAIGFLTQSNGAGVSVVTPNGFTNNFGVSGLSQTDVDDAILYLTNSGTTILYKGSTN